MTSGLKPTTEHRMQPDVVAQNANVATTTTGRWLTSHGRTLALAAVPTTALSVGLATMAMGNGETAAWVFAAGIIPVLIALLVSIARSLSRGEFGLDIIAALSMTGALLANEALAGVVVALMYSGGQLLEDYAQGRAQREMTALLGRVARTAQVYRGSTLVETPIEQLLPGDRLLMRASEILPADGQVHGGVALLDESSMTGEPMPVQRHAGEAVASGVANAGAPFDLVLTHTAANSTYAAVVMLVDAARFSKAPIARLADQYALGFLAITVALAGGAWFLTGEASRAVAVLVVATPCPLILAVPVAIVAGMSRAAKRGLLFKSARVLETLPRIRTIMFDKTGTVTDGYPKVATIEPAAGVIENDLISLAASLAQSSQHTISQALVAEARKRGVALTPPTHVEDIAGDGVKGMVGGIAVVIGRPDFVASSVGALTPLQNEVPTGATVLGIAINGLLAGRVVFVDSMRDDAIATIAALRAGGVATVTLITGDQAVVANDIGRRLGVDNVIAQATPQQKIDAVMKAKANAPTMMVGDGINDAPALAAADIGVAMGARGAAAAAQAADIVLLVDRVSRLGEAMEIARHTRTIALQSVIVGLGLSSVGMVLAALGYLPPLAGALAQEAIDVAVILNALRALGGGAPRTDALSLHKAAPSVP
jgi:heavy metal translocating P-type ATPase